MSSAAENRLGIDSLLLSDVNCHDIWDLRECAVANAHLWKTACETYRDSDSFKSGIPHHIHQIWIGTRQPPCVWLDTWRIDFMNAFRHATSSQSPDWQYTLWDNNSVRDMPMLNRALFEAESAPQCQADILRLEVLYEYGGVYVDADIVSTIRDMRPALEQARQTGFMITYEPDTKDKPYSILGNSLIACTPRHPLVLMLMSYIKQVYPHKRAHYGVEWVTGPLTYTKVLVHTHMPMTVPNSKEFYPAFHYIPNPSSIDVTTFDSYCFQFGYTCSGLSQWVAQNNKCRQAHNCSYHASIEYELGSLRQFPFKSGPSNENASIPNIIHQFSFQSQGSQPERWMNTWKNDFCTSNNFQYELWTWARLKAEIGQFFCANLYREGYMDSYALHMLILEVLHNCGGYYVPTTTIFSADSSDPEASTKIFGLNNHSEYKCGSILGCAAGSCMDRIKESYETGKIDSPSRTSETLPGELVTDMGFGDDIASTTFFKPTSRFLGASQIYYTPCKQADKQLKSSDDVALAWAYDCQVPIFKPSSEERFRKMINSSDHRSIVITDPQFALHSSLINEIPGVIYRLDEEGKEWDYVVLNVEWEANSSGLEVYTASSPFMAPKAQYLGFIVNNHASKCVTSTSIEKLLARHETGRVYVASEKSHHCEMVASIYSTIPSVSHVFRSLAGHEPSFYREHEEVVGDFLKGFKNGQIAFELQVDSEQRVMFRSWGDNGGMDCECKITPGMNGSTVEWLRVYQDHNITFETNGTFVR